MSPSAWLAMLHETREALAAGRITKDQARARMRRAARRFNSRRLEERRVEARARAQGLTSDDLRLAAFAAYAAFSARAPWRWLPLRVREVLFARFGGRALKREVRRRGEAARG